MALAATNSIYVVELALSGLSRNILHLKDIYVARVARFLQQVYGMARPAMAEALHMAHDDRLYDHELVMIQEDGRLTACLWYTLSLDARTTVRPEECEVYLGMLPALPDDRPWTHVWADATTFFPIHGYGRSEFESRVRSLWGVRYAEALGVVAKDRNYSAVMVERERAGLVPDRDLEYKQRLHGMTRGEASSDEPLQTVTITEREPPFAWDSLSMFSTGWLCSDRVEQQSQTEQTWTRIVAQEIRAVQIMKAELTQRSQSATTTGRGLADEWQGMPVAPMEIDEPSPGASETTLPVDLDRGVAVRSQPGGWTWGEAGREGSPEERDQDRSSDEEGPPFPPSTQPGSKHHPHSTPGAGPSKRKRDAVAGEDSMARQPQQPWESGVVQEPRKSRRKPGSGGDRHARARQE
ncbi:hypothetical protein FRC06_008008 [Ceratobasidium sp. 370]|nr:hypothetical protein FRC06_008008 [Ceratobasidium sp. 370]